MLRDREDFEGTTGQRNNTFVAQMSSGEVCGKAIMLMIQEPLPAQKELTAAVEEHWVDMMHTAFRKAAEQGSLPRFQKAMVEIHIATPRGSDNAKVWDTSNRAIQVILNNLKGIFFPNDDMEHVAFVVIGDWTEGTGYTTIRVSDFSAWRQIFHIHYEHLKSL